MYRPHFLWEDMSGVNVASACFPNKLLQVTGSVYVVHGGNVVGLELALGMSCALYGSMVKFRVTYVHKPLNAWCTALLFL